MDGEEIRGVEGDGESGSAVPDLGVKRWRVVYLRVMVSRTSMIFAIHIYLRCLTLCHQT